MVCLINRMLPRQSKNIKFDEDSKLCHANQFKLPNLVRLTQKQSVLHY